MSTAWIIYTVFGVFLSIFGIIGALNIHKLKKK